ncbi:hypothetical protein GRAN_4585 [Granulicella sibirica]|uniref:Uncharacterized protein n=1 Tax=Granulicella sibirica TaxID=2479048 RepID=A0A4Q0SXX4_9BACT|nr:hypothetical protein GRAN_4585 [Granulicella sibirica]
MAGFLKPCDHRRAHPSQPYHSNLHTFLSRRVDLAAPIAAVFPWMSNYLCWRFKTPTILL